MALEVKTKAEFKSKLEEAGDKLVVIDFHATWCGPCKRIAPFVGTLAEQHKSKLVVLKVDVDEIEELVSEYSIDVMPTFVFMRKGEHIDTLSGSNEEKLKDLIEKHLAKV